MQLLVYFFKKYRFFIFFLLLEFVAFSLIVQNQTYHKNKFVTSANMIIGGFYEKTSNIKNYFSLKKENNRLVEENILLKQELEALKYSSLDSFTKPILEKKFVYNTARIVKNSYNTNSYNFLLINKGSRDSIYSEMAVVNDKGIIGVTERNSPRYTRVQSILNLDSQINAELKNHNFYGSLSWDGQNYNIVQLTDLERQAPIKIGDTIVTGERSSIFPKGILIGKVIKINLESTTTSSVDVELFNDMSNLDHVYVIQNKHQQEIKDLENNNE